MSHPFTLVIPAIDFIAMAIILLRWIATIDLQLL